jgi:hypothetical protein
MLADDLDKTMVKVKIDGHEAEVSVEEMVRQYQKNGAADRRLAEANRLLGHLATGVIDMPLHLIRYCLLLTGDLE